nr:hypothetical protein [Tanacetum cinerariifolium]GEY13589.1 hypothetical protein [Tanacetum cinerariifolium]
MFFKRKVIVGDRFLAIFGDWVNSDIGCLMILVYAPQELARKQVLWNTLSDIVLKFNGPFLVLGDFNEEAKAKGRLEGIKVGINSIGISHLQFTDDALILGSIDSNKMSWVAWKKVCSPCKFRGLGIGSLQGSDLAMQTKWWWRFHMDYNSLWKQIITSIYENHRGLWAGSQSTSRLPSGPWATIIGLRKSLSTANINLENVFRRKVGDGSTFKF